MQAIQLEFYGDALVEAWRGTQHGRAHVRCEEGPEIFRSHFGRDFDSHAWGVAGDAHVWPQHLTIFKIFMCEGQPDSVRQVAGSDQVFLHMLCNPKRHCPLLRHQAPVQLSGLH